MIDDSWEQKLDELLDKESGLTPWEIDFIESLDERRGRQISEKQEEIIDRILERLS